MRVAGSLASVFTIATLAGLAFIAAPRRADGAATIVVSTAVDEDVDNGVCSLREAIIAANTNADYHGCSAGVGDMVTFDLGPGTPTINISTTPLPVITQAVTIDGGANKVELHGPGGPAASGHHGLTVAQSGFGTIIRNLVINNAGDDGIFIDADEVWVFGCYIGTDKTGTSAMPNQGFGIQIFGGNGNRVGGATTGGACTGDCNVIAGAINFKGNVLIDLNATNALVRGNFIGTDVTGTAAITPSTGFGIIDKGSSDRIGGQQGTTPGGACTGDCNLISGNDRDGGILIDQAATGSLVQGNFIGTDVTGTASISNGAFPGNSNGIKIVAAGATIGGTAPAARNLVSGNIGTGIQIHGINAVVQGNYIGTDTTGAAAVTNSGDGITVLEGDGAMIGGVDPGAGNLISGASTNGASGIAIVDSINAQVVGNLIGVAADGSTPLPNLGNGVQMHQASSNNTVGGASAEAGNVIAFNGLDGVLVDADIGFVRSNTVRGNSIYANGERGIALLDDANDRLDPPIIEGINPVSGTACSPCIVEIFSDDGDQGRVFEGTAFSATGTWTFEGTPIGPHVTATNTDTSNNTSEFSAPVSLLSPTPTASPTPPPATATPPHTSTATATRTSTATAPASATRTPSVSPTATASATATQSATAPPGATATRTAAATPTATVVRCTGDCNGNGAVSIDELVTGVGIALGTLPVGACTAFENDTGQVDIAQLVRGVANALGGCAA